MSKKKKKIPSWNPDSARKSFKIAKNSSQTDLNSSKNQRKIRPKELAEDSLIEDDFGISDQESTLRVDEEQLRRAFGGIL